MAVLDRVHPVLDLAQPGDGVGDADGQPQQDEPESVPELRGQRLVQRAEVERHERVDLVELLAARAEVAPDRARDRGDEHVVDRRPVGATCALDAPEVDRIAPGHAVGAMQPPLDRRAGIRPREEELRERLPVVEDGVGELAGVARVQQRAEALVRHALRSAQQRRGEAEARAVVLGRPADPGRGRGRAVGQEQHHPRERDAVGDAVMNAEQDGRARFESVDEVDLPQRAVALQRCRDTVGDERLQRGPVVRRRQRDVVEVQLGIEARVVLPVRSGEQGALDRALAEAREAPDHPLEEGRAAAGPVDRRVEPEDGVDDHEVRRAIHVQPGRVGGGHRVTGRHPPHGTRGRVLRHPRAPAPTRGKVRS